MKKYTNTTHNMLCVEFEGVAQFLCRVQSVTNDLPTIKVPKGILVEDLAVEAVVKPVKKTARKKKAVVSDDI